jgi:uncharacterized protein YndB with AHSA1/START domain
MPLAIQSPTHDLELIRDVALSPDDLFDGWTNPQTLPLWFCPKPWQVIECEIDLRPGGLFANTMQGPDGTTMPRGEGCFLLVDAPHRLVWANMIGPGFRPQQIAAPGFAFVCDLRFTPLPDGLTRYHARVMHADAEGKARHEAMGFERGWSAALDQLIALKQGKA